jgi:hypothetical protein
MCTSEYSARTTFMFDVFILLGCLISLEDNFQVSKKKMARNICRLSSISLLIILMGVYGHLHYQEQLRNKYIQEQLENKSKIIKILKFRNPLFTGINDFQEHPYILKWRYEMKVFKLYYDIPSSTRIEFVDKY